MVCELPVPRLNERGVPVIVARTPWQLSTSTYRNTARVLKMLGNICEECDKRKMKSFRRESILQLLK